jgi:hypothetical protein
MNAKLNESNPNEIMGYEPYFGKDVITGFINHESKTIRPAHGYFPPHRYGVENRKYAKDLGYNFISR